MKESGIRFKDGTDVNSIMHTNYGEIKLDILRNRKELNGFWLKTLLTEVH